MKKIRRERQMRKNSNVCYDTERLDCRVCEREKEKRVRLCKDKKRNIRVYNMKIE